MEQYRLSVSIIVPTHNRPLILIEAINSILNQTFKDLEIIVVNDGGGDVESIIAPFIDKAEIVYIKHNYPKGPSASRNSGIRAARGKYIAYLDDDDIYYPDHIETLVNFLENSECRAAYTDAYRVHIEKEGDRYAVKKRDLPYSFDFDPDLILIQNLFPTLTVMHERSCLDEVGFFDEALKTHEDWELWVRMSRRFGFAHIKKVTGEFRRMRDGVSTTFEKREDFLRTAMVIQERYMSYLKVKPWLLKASQEMIDVMRSEIACTHRVTPIVIESRPQMISSPISIVIPVQKNGEGLRALLSTIRSQKRVGDVEIIQIPCRDSNHSKIRTLAAEEAKGEYIFFMDEDSIPVNQYWLYNMVCPFLDHPELAALTCKKIVRPEEDLYGLWMNDVVSRSLDIERDYFLFIPAKDSEKIAGKLSCKTCKKKIPFWDNVLACYRRDSFTEIDDIDPVIRILERGNGVGFLSSTGIYYGKPIRTRDVFLQSFTETRCSEKVLLYFFTTNNLEWRSLVANIMGAWDLIKRSIAKSRDSDHESPLTIRSFLNALQRNIHTETSISHQGLEKEKVHGDADFEGLLKELIGDIPFTAETKYDFKRNFLISDFMNRFEDFTEFLYRTNLDLNGREEEFITCIYKIFAQVAGEAVGVFYLEKESMNRLDDEIARINQLSEKEACHF